MYQKGEYIIYGSNGVCEVVDVTTMNLPGIAKDRPYYVLKPYNEKQGRIYTPVENNKTVMRKVISRGEAVQLIDEMPDIEEMWITNDKMREEKYRECLKSCQCRDLVKVIKTLYMRRQERLKNGKKVTATDEKYLRVAEESLFSELAIPLEIPKNEVEQYIAEQILTSKEKEKVSN